MNKYAGIDYGLGKANIDLNTGIRYGVIRISSLHEFIWDELETEYGDPTCPECSHKVIDSSHGKDYFCQYCADRKALTDDEGELLTDEDSKSAIEDITFWSDEVFSDEPLGFFLTGKYDAHSAFDDSCLFITKSPYYTLASFCSPCAPGAGDLNNYNPDGVKTLCFGHDMFKGNKAPYPVYRVSDNSLVESV